MELIIETKNLCKDFKGHLAVNDVNMSITKGDIYGLIGRNGAGKTTLMRMLCGLASKTSGEIKLFGTDNLDEARKKIGCTIENPALYANMTAYENLEVYRILLGIKNTDIIDELLDLVGLSDVGKKKAKDFSLGMKQRLMIAISLLDNPELLILDEPMNGLDPTGIKEVRDLLLRLNKERGLTIIVSSHILDELFKITSRYGVINDGMMIDEFSHEELIKRCKKNIKIVVDKPDIAQNLLYELGFKKIEINDKTITLYDNFDKTEQIAFVLSKNNVKISSLIPGEQAFEDYFMSLIQGE